MCQATYQADYFASLGSSEILFYELSGFILEIYEFTEVLQLVPKQKFKWSSFEILIWRHKSRMAVTEVFPLTRQAL